MQEELPELFKTSTSRLGFKCIDELLELTFYELQLMLEGKAEVEKEQAEMQFYILKRAISDVLNGKNSPLFKQRVDHAEVMSKEENEAKFQELLKKFEKKSGG